ncbi:serine/threonine-protein phosphatase 6 regulatory ankyrin repeat subunit B [Aspergillus udagawae]|nr:serine/threonine-protein phosphatase 6 regulatory ankyrin repeat subunit B [Aspergillus udagawae]
MPQLEQLPMELLLAITDHLDPLSVASLGQTSRRLNGTLQRLLARAAKQYALADEAEYKQRITFHEDGKGIRTRKRTHRVPSQPLVQAIRRHQLNKVRNYLEAGVDPNAYDLDGHRMLSLAVRAKDEPTVDLLLEHGANPALNDVCAPYNSPVLEAIKMGDDIVKKLISMGADYTQARVTHALAGRCSLDVIKLTIDKGADFGQPSFDGRTAIHHAATNVNHPDVLEFLVEQYPALLSSQSARTFLWSAIYNGSAELVKTLITAGVDIAGDTPIHSTLASCCSLDVIKAAIDKGADFGQISPDGRTIIHYAATNTNHPDVLKFLIGKYPELLSSQSTRGKTALWSALYEGSAELAKILITAGIDINIRDHAGKTALHAPWNSVIRRFTNQWKLHHAVRQNGHYWLHKSMPSIVRLLLSRSTVDVNALGPGGLTPLHLAAKVGWLKVVRILVEEGNADVTETDNYGKVPAHLALESPAVLKYLLRRAANRSSVI